MENHKIVEVTSVRGRKMLEVNGYKFSKQREAYNITKWRCVRARQLSCHATFYTDKGDKVIPWKDNSFEHNHTARTSVQMVRDQVIKEMKRKILEAEPTSQVTTRQFVEDAMESIDWMKMPPLTAKEHHYIKQSVFYACQYRLRSRNTKSTDGIPHHHARAPEMGNEDSFETLFSESDGDDVIMKVGEDTEIIPLKPSFRHSSSPKTGGQCTSKSNVSIRGISGSDPGIKNAVVRAKSNLDKSQRPPETTDGWTTKTAILFVSPTVIPLKEVFSKQDPLVESKDRHAGTKTVLSIKKERNELSLPQTPNQPGGSNNPSSREESVQKTTDSRHSVSSDIEEESDDTDRKFILSLLPKYRRLTPADKSMFRAQALQLLQWKLKDKA